MSDKGVDCPNFDKLPNSCLLRILQWKFMALFYHIIDIPSVVLFLLSGTALVVSTGYGVLSLDVFPVLLWNAFENYCICLR